MQREKFKRIRQEPQTKAEWLGSSVHSAICIIFKQKRCRARTGLSRYQSFTPKQAQASQPQSKRLWTSFAERGTPMVQRYPGRFTRRAGPLANLNSPSLPDKWSEGTKRVRRLLAQPIRHTLTVICLAGRWQKITTRSVSPLPFD